jgi:hypothetical protein
VIAHRTARWLTGQPTGIGPDAGDDCGADRTDLASAIERQPVLPNAADDPSRYLTAMTLTGLAR